MIFTFLFFLKLVITILFVIFLSWIAEKFGPKFSGIISGVPTGTAIILFFFGLEQGPAFASKSAMFNLSAMLAMQVFIFIYYKLSNSNKKVNILLSSLGSGIGFVIMIFLLSRIDFSIYLAALEAIITIPLFSLLFKKIDNSRIKKRLKLSSKVIFSRALVATSIIMVVTGIAQIIGPKWAGLISSFPTTLFPLMLIIHWSYDKEHVHTIIKNVVKGQWAMLLYLVSIYFTYPLWGVILGTLFSYFLVIVYLFFVLKNNG